MAKREPKSLFRRLTRMFRGNPLVKRKIRGLDTGIAVADKTKSSGTLLFQKSLSPTYATITSNAYNLSERLMRYQDFQEMEYCVHGGQLIASPDVPGGFITIADLAAQCIDDPEKTFIVYSYDHEIKRMVPAFAKQARQTRVDHAWKVTFDNGKVVIGSSNHQLMLRDGTYREIGALAPGDSMMPFYRKDLFAGAKEGTKGYSWVYTMDDRFRGWTKEHQLIAEWIAGRELTKDECVHHINFVKTDNRPENLRIMMKSDHDSYHATLNNVVKWAPENHEWIEGFKRQHSAWMRDNAPTRRRDVTFACIVDASKELAFNMCAVSRALDVDLNVIYSRLVLAGFQSYETFADTYRDGDAVPQANVLDLGINDLNIDTINACIVEDDTKKSLAVRLGCTVNVLDKFLARRANMTWSALRLSRGWEVGSARKGGRPKGSIKSGVTFKHVCDAYEPGISRARLAKKLNVRTGIVMQALSEKGYSLWSSFASSYQNCRVVSVEYVGKIPLYDLTVDGYKNFATDSVISHNTPEIACVTKDSIVSTPSGDRSIEDLISLYGENSDEKFYVYSFDEKEKRLVVGQAHHVRKTKSERVVKVKFDSGSSIRCTPDHLFLTRSGEWVKAGDLLPGQSLMPFSREYGRQKRGYNSVYTIDDGWQLEHQFVASRCLIHRKLRAYPNEVVHHVDFNKCNNDPSNLRVLSAQEHNELHGRVWSDFPNEQRQLEIASKISAANKGREPINKGKSGLYVHTPEAIQKIADSSLRLHSDSSYSERATRGIVEYSRSDIGRNAVSERTSDQNVQRWATNAEYQKNMSQIFSKSAKKLWSQDGFSETVHIAQRAWFKQLSDEEKRLMFDHGDVNTGRIINIAIESAKASRTPNEMVEGFDPGWRFRNTQAKRNYLNRFAKRNGFRSLREFHDHYYSNHVVVSVEMGDVEDVYDLTTDVYHNFACNGVIVHNSALDIYSDEACAQDDKGQVLHVYSDNEKVKEILEDLFYNVLNVEFNLRSWVRNLPVHKDTVIPLLDGRNITIEQLAREHEEGKESWVYSVQDGTLRTVPGKVAWCGLTRKDSELVRVWLDDGTYVDCTPDHRFKLRDGTSREAQELSSGESLMPFYRKVSSRVNGDRLDGYEEVYDAASGRYVYTHRRIAEVLEKGTLKEGRWLRSDEHRELTREQLQAKGLMKTSWVDEGRRKKAQANMAIKFDQQCVDLVVERLAAHRKYVSPKVLGNQLKNDEAFMGHFRAINEGTKRDLTKALNSHAGLETLLGKAGVASYVELVKVRLPVIASTPWFQRAEKKNQKVSGVVPAPREAPVRLNHRVDRVERLATTSDVYCMEVLGANGEHDRHNFMVLTNKVTSDGIISGNCSGICLENCKYGDAFLYNDVSPEYGVVNAFPIPVNEIEREENYDRDDPFAVRYRWVTLGNRTLENWEVTHFRLLGNDMFLPYGSSVIEPARRIWRQLILIEDAMLVYRVVRAPERRVFYVDVANVPPENVPTYIEEQRRNLRTNQVIDQQTSRVDLRYNPMPMRKDTRVPMIDGRTLELHELASEFEAGKENWVYSIQKETNRVVPGKVVWCGKNYTCDKIHRVWLDDGSYLDAAPEHPFVLRDGTGCRADELQPGDSLMPLYRRQSSRLTGNLIKNYPMFQENNTGEWKFLHRCVAKEVLGESRKNVEATLDRSVNKNLVVHHKDFDSNNAHPSNLQWMGNVDHWKYHASIGRERLIKYNKSDVKRRKTSEDNRKYQKAQKMGAAYNGTVLHASHNEIRRKAQYDSWNSNKVLRSSVMRWIIPNEVVDFVFDQIKKDPKISREEVTQCIRHDVHMTALLAGANANNRRDVSKFHISAVISKVKRMGLLSLGAGYSTFRKYVVTNQPPQNHQVARVEILSEVDDVYCLTVHGPNGEHDRHTVAVQGREGAQGVVFIQQSVDEDFFIPVRGADSGTRIETLAGGQNAAAVEDVAYIQKKLFAALKIPRAYLGYDEMLSCVVPETPVDLLDGRTLTLDQIKSELDAGKEAWVYSVDQETRQLKPGRVLWCGPTRKNAELVRVTLDNGMSFDCTPDHKWMLRDGSWCQASQLEQGTSLMPVYRERKSLHGGCDYEKVYDPATGKWVWTHQLVFDNHPCGVELSASVEPKTVIHHRDGNRFNNNPSNLVKMGFNAHRDHHASTLAIVKKKALLEGKYSGLNNGWAKKCRRRVAHLWSTQQLISWCQQNEPQSKREIIAGYGLTETQLSRLLSENDMTYATFASLYVVGGYKLDRDGNKFNHSHRSHTRHKGIGFGARGAQAEVRQCPTCRAQFECNVKISKVFCNRKCVLNRLSNGHCEKIVVRPGRLNHKVISVVPLTERRDTWCMEIANTHNFALSNSVIISNSKATLAQEDIRFSRTVAVIQKTMLAELNKLAIIHLYSRGYDNEDLQNFTLRLSNPSTVAQQQKLELWRAKFEIGSSLPEGMGSRQFVQHEIWDLSEEEIETINEQRLKEKLQDASIEAASPEEGGGGGGGEGGEEDLFGGEGGGGEEEAGGGKEETPPEENAGEEPEEETEPEAELLTSSDDQEDSEEFALKLPINDGDSPVKPKNQTQKNYAYNRSRIQNHGPAKTHMPDFAKMTGNSNDAMEDPTGSEWRKSVVTNPFGEAKENRSPFGGMAPDLWSTLRRMTVALKMNRGTSGGVIIEGDQRGKDVQDEIDEGIELLDEPGQPEAPDLGEALAVGDGDDEPDDGGDE